ncbi:hypothetical protein ACOACO_18465 [Nocardioides sp. CPCC 205120]|uniref:hypothetical protein n=1 Tax=Nocardioides sp. CPCC 205120 TaxID=3406462 RepID=UPI003B511FF1
MSAGIDHQHPPWCTDHAGFDDGSDDWHKSADVVVGDHTFYVSTGTHTGAPEVFMRRAASEGTSLDDAEALGRALITAAGAAREDAAQ